MFAFRYVLTIEALNIEAVCSSETLIYSQNTTLRNNPEDHYLPAPKNISNKSCGS
jgi:hypothetical protein